MAYDQFKQLRPQSASQEYVKLLELAAHKNEAAVDGVLLQLLEQDTEIKVEQVARLVDEVLQPQAAPDVQIASVDLNSYDCLLSGDEGGELS
jgi:hypothetical protein